MKTHIVFRTFIFLLSEIPKASFTKNGFGIANNFNYIRIMATNPILFNNKINL